MNETEKEVDPSSWSAFWDKTTALLKKSKDDRVADGIKKTMASEERLAELSESVRRGREARKFLEGDFWNDDVEPFLRGEAILKPWSPKQDETVERRALNEFIFGSGQVRVLTRFLDQLEKWQIEGIEADKIINEEIRKKSLLKSA